MKIPLTIASLVAVLITGCGDERLVELSRESLDRQSEQNQQMGEQTQQVAEATRQLVEADAQARRDVIKLQQSLQAERVDLEIQRQGLESERRELAKQRVRDPLVAQGLVSAAMLIATILPLLVCIHLFRSLWQTSDSQIAEGWLLEEITAADSVLLREPLAIEQGPRETSLLCGPWDPLESTCRHASLSIL